MPSDDYQIVAELEVIDATLAGEPVDPVHAELAELALLLAGDRPVPDQEFTRRLDGRVASRFANGAAANGPVPTVERNVGSRWRSLRWRGRAAVFGTLAAAALAAAVCVVVLGSSSTPRLNKLNFSRPSSSELTLPSAVKTAAGSSTAATSSSAAGTSGLSAAVPTPTTGSGRKIVQSAQLQLSVSTKRIDTVAQELFDVVGQENGIVNSSQVTSGSSDDSSASFTLSIPTANLQSAMTRLSTLDYANVVSRGDSTQDVTDTYQADVRNLADARALRTSLLRQLQTADTEAAVDSLDTQIQDAETTITNDQTTLAKLQQRISYSSLQVQVNAAAITPLNTARSSGLTIGRAVHDAGRVLVFAAGVILIALAVMVPLALVVALLLWVGLRLRRGSRERALDRA